MPITLHDIAAKAGVSHTTVSRVVNGAENVKENTKRKVQKAIEELNYVPNAYARGLSQKQSDVIGVVVPEIRNTFFGEMIEGITSVADKNHLTVLLFNTDENALKEKRALKFLQEHRVRGLILTPATSDKNYTPSHVDSLKKLNIPTILVDRVIPGINLDGLYADNMQSLYEATSLLIDEGHRDIAVLAGDPKLQLARERVAGYKLAFESRNLKYNEKNIFFCEFSKECGYNQTLHILGMKRRPTAILSNNNMLSLGCLKALYEKRLRIPEDIAFLGYDSIEELNILQSNITLVDKQAFDYGQNAMQLLLKRIENPEMAIQKIIISGKLVKRGSEKLVHYSPS